MKKKTAQNVRHRFGICVYSQLNQKSGREFDKRKLQETLGVNLLQSFMKIAQEEFQETYHDVSRGHTLEHTITLLNIIISYYYTGVRQNVRYLNLRI